MFEYSSVSASSYDPSALVAKLNDSTAEGWEVVAIVPTGGDVSAFLRREVPSSESDATTEEPPAEAGGETPVAEVLVAEGWAADVVEVPASDQPDDHSDEEVAAAAGAAYAAETWAASDPASSVDSQAATEEPSAVEEPAGWAAAPVVPEAAGEEPAAAQAVAEEPAAESEQAAGPPIDEVVITEIVAEPAPEPIPQAPVPEPAPVVTTPAGWYPDPSGRFELRYWDGTQWTEHVARSGQQFTDPPVR